MFSLIRGFYQMWTEKPSYKVIIIGLDNAGKSTLVEQVKKQEGLRHTKIDRITPTVGLNVAKITKY